MGFLTSGLTEAQQSQNQANFQLGMNIGVTEAHTKLAAANAIKQTQIAQQAESDRQLANIQAQNEAKRYYADQRLQGIQDKSASDFTSKRASDATRYISTIAGRTLSGLDQYIKHPDVYSPETIKAATTQANQLLGITADFDASIARMKPGDDVDYTPFSSKIASLNDFTPSFSDEYTEKKRAEIGKLDAQADGTGGYAPKTGGRSSKSGLVNTTTGIPQVFSDWQDAISGYHAANQNLNARKTSIDVSEKDYAESVGRNPFAYEDKEVEKYSSAANQWGIAAMTAATQDDSDLGRLYKHLRKKGIQPFTPQTVDQVGGELNKIYNQLSDDNDRNAVAGASLIFTGKPVEAWKPIPTGTSDRWAPTGAGGAIVPQPLGAPDKPGSIQLGINPSWMGASGQ